jgi:hypothetical protein
MKGNVGWYWKILIKCDFVQSFHPISRPKFVSTYSVGLCWTGFNGPLLIVFHRSVINYPTFLVYLEIIQKLYSDWNVFQNLDTLFGVAVFTGKYAGMLVSLYVVWSMWSVACSNELLDN